MVELIWSEPALQDLDAIADYIALDKPEAAPDRFCFHKKSSFVFLGAYEQNQFYGFSYRFGNYRHYFWVNTRNNETHIEVKPIEKSQEINIEKFYDEVAHECSIQTNEGNGS